MPVLFKVESTDIIGLNDIQLTCLLKLLLHLEARTSGIAEMAVEVALNITVADGGEDGRIQWNGGPENTTYLPSRFVQFQNKATYMPPSECANEITNRDGSMKHMVEEALDNGANYILFHNQELNRQQKDERIEKIRQKLRDFGKPYADTVIIEIYDAATIEGWVNKYLAAIVAVLNWVGRPLERGLKTWDDWSRHREYQDFPFVADEDRERSVAQLKELLKVPRKCARIVGLSGLGKTRLAFEIFRDVAAHDDFSKRVIYVDAGANAGILGLITDWVQCGLEGIVVVDNCDISLHDKIRREIQRTDSKISLLTVDYNFERANQTVVVHVKQFLDEHIKRMLEPVYGDRISDLDRIVSFAQGFPQMAVLLADARLEQEPEMGRLSDDDLAHKMLWGGRDHSEQDERILKGCALFDRFGLDEEVSLEYEFIARQVVNVGPDVFFDCVKRFEERGLIDRRGRFAKLVPKPLAIRLAAEWWRRTRIERQMELVNSNMPGALVESFCDQVSMLDFLPEVKALTEGLCGVQGPFGQAEVILSDRGSRLFRSFVEVNPEATSKALSFVLANLSDEKLKSLGGDIRRNLVWGLEKLCFHIECFQESARSLLLLASEENEQWHNSATGQFQQLFRPFLSGTEAPPAQRLEVIDYALKSAKESFQRLAVSALEKAIDTHGGMRVVGAEFQGSGVPLEEWKPKVWGEVFKYWEEALLRLCVLIEEGGPLASDAKNAVASHIRGLMMNGQVMILDTVIKRVVAAQGPLWPEALDDIKDSLRYEGEKMPAEGKAKLEEWVRLLTPSDKAERLSLIITHPSYEHEMGEDGKYIDIAAENAKALAVEFAPDLGSLTPHLTKLVVGEQRQAYLFGMTLVESARQWEPLLTETIAAIKQTDKPNINLLLGILNGIYQLEAGSWEKTVDALVNEEYWVQYYPYLVTSGEVKEHQLHLIVDFVSSSKLSPSSVSVFTYGRPLEHLTAEKVSSFVLRFACISDDSRWVGIDILSMYCLNEPTKWEECKETFIALVKNLRLDKKNKHVKLETHHWKSIVGKLLNTEGSDFAKAVSETIVASCTDHLDYGDLIHYVKPITRKLFRNFGPEVWPIFVNAINSADRLTEYRLIQLLDSGDPFTKKEPSVLAELPDKVLIEWCMQNQGTAPEFVARATDVYKEQDGEYQLSDRAKFLLDNFGNDEKVLSALSANMSSFGWSGSVVPYYQKEIASLEAVKAHENIKVRDWACRRIEYLAMMIEKEKRRDEEKDWGLY